LAKKHIAAKISTHLKITWRSVHSIRSSSEHSESAP
jgi:hypothetical protein